ncbi:MAG TPA: TetR family transcriptional regulator [Flavobacterium sp.]|jgi:AcrR family transcriptional regulator
MGSVLTDKQIEILKVAERLFAEKGFDGTSVRDIANEASINVAMVSYYFGSKQKMLESLMLFRTADLKLQLESLHLEPISPLEKIDKLVELYISRIHKNRLIYKIVHFEISSNKRNVDLEAFTEVKKNNIVSLQKIIGEGQEKGVFRKDVNINLLAPTILGTFFHLQMNRVFYEEMLGLKTDEEFDHYMHNDLIKHIQQTIKALLTYESN